MKTGTSTPGSDSFNWRAAPLADLIDDILAVHHAYLRAALPRIASLFHQASTEATPELGEAREIFMRLQSKIEPHLADEEQTLFPVCRLLALGSQAPVSAGIIERLDEMEEEHKNALAALARMRSLTGGFAADRYSDPLAKEIVAELSLLCDDLTRHIEKENEALHPLAKKLLEQAIS